MYQTNHNGVQHELGTSGFVYRSSKLMYDQATKSLWSTLQGEPVVGSLVDNDIKLESLPSVTTTWENWCKQHPDTTVLDLKTGFDRDYGEGVAYREYFSTDRLVYNVANPTKPVLPNKADVLALRRGKEQLAISVDFLSENRVYHDKVDRQEIVILTDSSGANRVFECGSVCFENWNADNNTATDSEGQEWSVSEVALKRGDAETLERVSAHRTFWFGWYAQFPSTRIVVN